MKYIQSIDDKGNVWRIESKPNPTYKPKSTLTFYLNDKEFKLMGFLTVREHDMFWELLKNSFKGDILTKASTEAV